MAGLTTSHFFCLLDAVSAAMAALINCAIRSHTRLYCSRNCAIDCLALTTPTTPKSSRYSFLQNARILLCIARAIAEIFALLSQHSQPSASDYLNSIWQFVHILVCIVHEIAQLIALPSLHLRRPKVRVSRFCKTLAYFYVLLALLQKFSPCSCGAHDGQRHCQRYCANDRLALFAMTFKKLDHDGVIGKTGTM